MLILKQLHLKTFLSHHETIIDFKPKQKVLIDGKSGAGKSAIVEAIVWVLYGKGRSDNKSLIKHGEKMATVILIVEDGEDVFRIERTATSTTNKLQLSKQTKKGNFLPIKVSGMKATQEHLENEILHSSYLLFINSIVYQQESSDTFVKQTAAKRKEILLEIAKTSDYDEYYKKAKEKLDEINKLVEIDLAVMESLKANIEHDKKFAAELPERKEKKENAEHIIDVIKDDLHGATEKIKKAQEQVEKKGKIQADISLVEYKIKSEHVRIDSLNEQIMNLSKIDVDGMRKQITELEKYRVQYQHYTQQEDALSEWKTKRLKLMDFEPLNFGFDKFIADINEQIITLMNTKRPVCPSPECPYMKDDHNGQLIKGLEERMELKIAEKKQFEKDNAEYELQVKELGPEPVIDIAQKNFLEREIEKLKQLEYDVKAHATVESDINELNENVKLALKGIAAEEEKLQQLRADFATINVDTEDFKKMSELQTDLQDKLEKAQNTYSLALVQYESALEAEKRVRGNKEKIKELQEKTEKYSDQVDGLKMLKQAFGNNGIKAMVVDYIIPRLEEKINDILGQLSDFRVKLETQRTGTKEAVIEGLFITIINEHGLEFSFSNYSGGERLKIVIAISEALADIQKVGFRVMDETFIGLDEESTEKFVEVMATLQNRFEQMLCISHLRNIKDTFDERMEVIKLNGNSEIT